MKKTTLIFALLVMAISFASNAQDNQGLLKHPANPKLIAVVNSADWCPVCKANGPRFGALAMPYAARGVSIYVNDLTNETTKAASKSALENAGIYEAVTTIPRKGIGHLLKSCGLAKDKRKLTEVSGIATFINPETHKQLKQLSIAGSDDAMKATIESLLKQKL